MTTEKSALRTFIRICKQEAPGCTFTVEHEEGTEIENATSEDAIIEASCATGFDTLIVREPEGRRLGAFSLIWGNAENGEELIADYGVNNWTDRVWNLWNAEIERLNA